MNFFSTPSSNKRKVRTMSKMKDVFELPLDIHHDHIYYNVDDNFGRTIYTLSSLDDSAYKEAEMIIHAVNSHDSLVEQLEVAEKALNNSNKKAVNSRIGHKTMNDIVTITTEALDAIEKLKE